MRRIAAATAAMAIVMAGCATPAAGRNIGGAWRVADLNGVPVAGAAPTLTLADGRASGSGGCNSWSADYERRSRERIRLGAIVSTEMACEPAVMEQERRFFDLLAKVQGYMLYGNGTLSLIAADGSAIRLRRP